MHVDESEKLPMENSEMIQENMNETIEIEIKEHRKTLSKVEGTQVLASIDNLAKNFDYKPNTSIDDGNLKFVNWYKQYFNL